MKIMINLEGTDNCREFEVSQVDMKVLEFKKFLQNIYNIPYNEMELLLQDFPLNDKQVLSQVGIDDNLITLRKKNPINKSQPPPTLSQSNRINNISTPTPTISQSNRNVIPNPNLIQSNRNISQNPIQSNRSIPLNQSLGLSNRNISQNPNLTQSRSNVTQNPILSEMPNYDGSFQQVNNPLGLSQSSLLNDALAYNDLLGISQSSPEAQRRIENIINQQRINDNFRHAAEYMPESLFPVPMLFINVEINNQKVAALVDTGAQSTFMSKDLCTKCGLMNMVDKRFQGIARGVGASRIVGVIHAAQIKIMNKMIATKINVIENNEVGLVFGLDSLRAHRCNVDLKINGLVFPDIGITAKFLSDGEIKKLKEQKILDEENAEIERAKKESLNYV
jgi:DNA damage-inducible protein 1